MMKYTEIKLPFGLNKNNILVHISDVENGKKCECICPECKTPLIAANKGRKIQPHFKHAVSTECNGGLESAIHLAAKQIINERKKITLPQCEITATKIDSKGKKHTEKVIVTENGTVICFDDVREEFVLHGMKTDILASTGDRQLIIEIFYSHKVDDHKLEKIIQANISAIEIKLSDLKPEEVKNWESFWLCINDPKRIKWLHNAKAIHYKSKLQDLMKKKLHAQEENYKKDEIEMREKVQFSRKQLLEALDEIKPLYSKENVAHFKHAGEQHPIWKFYRRVIRHSWQDLPGNINANVTDGDWIFGCDRRIWQMDLFIAFICRQNKTFSIEMADNWLQNERGYNVHSAVRRVEVCVNEYRQLNPIDYILINTPSSWKTLQSYFSYLCELRMLELVGGTNGNYLYKIPTQNRRPQPQYSPSNRVLRRSRRL